MSKFILTRQIPLGLIAVLTVFTVNSLNISHAQPADQPADQYAQKAEKQTETYIFSANKMNTKSAQVGSSVTVVDTQQIQAAKKESMTELLKSTTGINITETSANGAKGLMIRGASTNHTLVMIDGVIVNDPISGGRSFNFGTLNMADIARIEVLKGPQSVLYGSDAMGGVVQIFTKKGEAGQKPSATIELAGGSYGFNKQSASVNGGTEKWNYAVGITNSHEQGISAAEKKDGNRERDAFTIRTATINLSYTPIDWLLFDLNLRGVKQKLDYDNHSGVGGDDPNLWQDYDSFSGKFGVTAFLFDDKLESSLSYDRSITKRYDINDPDTESKNSSKSAFKGETNTWSFKNTLTLHPNFKTVFGLNRLEESGETYYNSTSYYGGSTTPSNYESVLPTQKQVTQSAYIDQHIDIGSRWFNTIGMRYDSIKGKSSEEALNFVGKSFNQISAILEEQYKKQLEKAQNGKKAKQDALTYRATSRFNITDSVAIKGSYGTGFKSPTLYQRFEPTYGNLNLESEKSKGYDVGFVLTHKNHLLDVTYFNNNFSNLIEFSSKESKYYNVAKARMRGVEVNFDSSWTDQFSSRIFYTYLDAKNKEKQISLLQRPRHHFGMSGQYKLNDQHSIYVDTNFLSGSDTSNFGSKEMTVPRLKAYWLTNIAYEYNVNKTVSLTAKINNVFDKRYQTGLGYGQKRVNGSVGIKLVF